VIEDNGVGISEQNQSKLFQDYQMLEEHEQINRKGTGLGLSICKNLIQEMGGDVAIESVVNIGTKLIIKIQLKAIHIDEDAFKLPFDDKEIEEDFSPV
jgi:signal transduction histidine kinase